MNDTPTPRTDAFAKSIDQSNFEDSWKDDFEEFAWVTADFARTLETELTTVTEQLDEMTLRWELTNDSLFDKRALADRLAEELTTTRQAHDVVVLAFRKVDAELTAAREEIDHLKIHLVTGNDAIESFSKELATVTEQRDGLRSGIDYASDQLSKVTEQRDRLDDQLDEILLRLGRTQERMFNAERQRDRLAEALKRIANNNVQDEPHTCYAYEFGRMEGIAKIALAAVKGGSDE